MLDDIDTKLGYRNSQELKSKTINFRNILLYTIRNIVMKKITIY